jgi:hypothetical protein
MKVNHIGMPTIGRFADKIDQPRTAAHVAIIEVKCVPVELLQIDCQRRPDLALTRG